MGSKFQPFSIRNRLRNAGNGVKEATVDQWMAPNWLELWTLLKSPISQEQTGVYSNSCAEYCAPSKYRSSHIDKVDVQLNSAMCTIITNILPPELRLKIAVHKEWFKCFHDSWGDELLIKNDLTHPSHRRLSSRSSIWIDVKIRNESFAPTFIYAVCGKAVGVLPWERLMYANSQIQFLK